MQSKFALLIAIAITVATSQCVAAATAPLQSAIVPTIFDNYSGRYQLAPEVVLTVTREGNHIMVQQAGQGKFEIYPKGEHEFFLKVVDAKITFVVDAKGAATSLILSQNGLDFPGERIGDAPPPVDRREVVVTQEVLEQYVGRYQLMPGIVLSVARQANELSVQVTGQSAFPVYATSEKEFFYKSVDAQITFVTDESRRAAQLVLHQNGRDMPAMRIE